MKGQNILIINPFGIGDVLFSTPLVKAIKKTYPDGMLAYICNKRAYGVLKDNPHISKLYIFEKDDYRRIWKESKIRCLKAVHSFLQAIKKDGYDVVFDMTLSHMTSLLLLAFSNIRRRIGFNYRNRGRFLTDKVSLEGFNDKHVIEYYLSLGSPIDINTADRQMELFISDEDRAWAEGYLAQNGVVKGGRLCALIPGCGISWGQDAKYRRWAPGKFAEVADHAAVKYGCKVIIFGEKSEAHICGDVASRMKASPIEMCGKTNMGQFTALLDRCDLVITNDGGPLHMAVALKKKIVAIFGPVDEKIYGPYPPSPRYAVVTSNDPCRPCYKNFRHTKCGSVDCLAHIQTADVIKAIDKVMEGLVR